MTETTTLDDIKELLQSTIDALQKAIKLEAELNQSYEELMNNAKAVEVAGLKRPNFFPYIQELKVQEEVLLTLKFHVECRIKDNQKLKIKKD